jgi:hypothetical protein
VANGSPEGDQVAFPFGYALTVRRTVVGWLLAAFGVTTMTLAVAGCFWVYLNFYPGQFDLTPAWVTGSVVLLAGGALLAAGVVMLDDR